MEVRRGDRAWAPATLTGLIGLLKGIVIGAGAIVPGLSGGVLAVVLGLYLPLMQWLGNPRERLSENLRLFAPVALGWLLGLYAFAAAVEYVFANHRTALTWLFVGLIAGTIPTLASSCSEKGRKAYHWLVVALCIGVTWFVMRGLETTVQAAISAGFASWLLCGSVLAVGFLVPGLSSSNLLIYLQMYEPMARAIYQLDLAVITPLVIGLVVSLVTMLKAVTWLLKRAFVVVCHVVLGVVIGSTMAIVPIGADTVSAASAVMFGLGWLCSYGLTRLEKRTVRTAAS